MKVQVNDKEVDLPPHTTLQQLAANLDMPAQGIAIAVNNRMVPRAAWAQQQLAEGDSVVIVKAACGG